MTKLTPILKTKDGEVRLWADRNGIVITDVLGGGGNDIIDGDDILSYEFKELNYDLTFSYALHLRTRSSKSYCLPVRESEYEQAHLVLSKKGRP